MTSSSKPKKEGKEKTPAKKTSPGVHLKTFRKKDIGATVWFRTKQGGLEYLSFSLSRSYKQNEVSDEWSYSSDFFSRNAAALKQVIDEAEAYMAQYSDDPRAALEAKGVAAPTNGVEATVAGESASLPA